MRMGRALSNTFAAVTRGGPQTYAGLVDAAGGTKAAAKELGISQREVQRQVAYDKAQRGEQPKGQQQRKFSAGQQAKLAEAVEAKDWEKEREKYKGGMRAHVSGEFEVSEDRSERDLEVEIEDEELLDDFFDALEAHDYKEAANIFNEMFGEAYDVPGSQWTDIDEFDISPL